jgi:hypothetical protein
MNEIRRVLQQASWRLLMIDLLRTLSVCMAGAVGALIVALFVERIFGVAIRFPGDWVRLALISAAAAGLVAIAWRLFRQHRGVALARELDERANLKETLSTAMCVAHSDDPWSRVVLETAREKAVGVNVKHAIPITAPRVWPLPFAMLLALVVLWFSIPRWDVLGLFNKRQIAAQEQQSQIQATSESKEAIDKVMEKLKSTGVEVKLDDDAAGEAGENQKPKSAEDIRRDAVKRLTQMTERLNAEKAGEKAQQMQALKDVMKQLKQPGPGPLDQLSKAMAQGDFQKAKEELGELAKQLGSDALSKEQKEQMQAQLQKLQDQMQKLADDRQQMEKQLEKAGLPKGDAQKLAKDPEALKKALEQLNNLTDEQKKQLMQKAMAQSSACKQCESMSESLSKMCQGMSQSGMNGEGMEGMEGLAGQLSELEMAGMELESLDAASQEAMRQLAKMAGQCNGGNCNNPGEPGDGSCQSPWRAGDTANRPGNGSGGPGQGNGMSPEEIDSPVSIEKTMAQSKNTGGPITGSRLVYGEQIRGESTADFAEAVESSAKAATEAIEGMQIRRELHGPVKRYFGRMEERAKKKGP